MDDQVHVLGLAGSLRAKSFNRALLRTAIELAPDGLAVEPFEHLGEIPLYDDDIRVNRGFPDAAEELRDRLRTTDALLIATPEYNYGIPGVLKNALDWASRPPDQPFEGLPVALMSAAPGRLGGARAQYQLRQCFVFLNALVLNKPEVMIANAGEMFDDGLRLTDTKSREMIQRLLASLLDWTRRHGRTRRV